MEEYLWPFANEEMRKLPGQAMRFATPQCAGLGGRCGGLRLTQLFSRLEINRRDKGNLHFCGLKSDLKNHS